MFSVGRGDTGILPLGRMYSLFRWADFGTKSEICGQSCLVRLVTIPFSSTSNPSLAIVINEARTSWTRDLKDHEKALALSSGVAFVINVFPHGVCWLVWPVPTKGCLLRPFLDLVKASSPWWIGIKRFIVFRI